MKRKVIQDGPNCGAGSRRHDVQILVLVTLFVSGCSGNPVGKVTGLVTMNGKPLPHTEVTFTGKDDPKLGSYATRTQADGRFELFQDPRPGVYIKPGRYVALVANQGEAPKEEEPAAVAPGTDGGPRNSLPQIYNQTNTSPLVVEVKPGDNYFELELKTSR